MKSQIKPLYIVSTDNKQVRAFREYAKLFDYKGFYERDNGLDYDSEYYSKKKKTPVLSSHKQIFTNMLESRRGLSWDKFIPDKWRLGLLTRNLDLELKHLFIPITDRISDKEELKLQKKAFKEYYQLFDYRAFYMGENGYDSQYYNTDREILLDGIYKRSFLQLLEGRKYLSWNIFIPDKRRVDVQLRDTSILNVDPIMGRTFSLFPKDLSKSAKKSYVNCPKQYWFRYLKYPDFPFLPSDPAIEGTDFHDYSEVFDYEAFYFKGKDYDTEYYAEDRESYVFEEYKLMFLDWMQKRKDSLSWENFRPQGLEVPLVSNPIRGFVDLITAVLDDDGNMIGLSIDEIKPSRDNYEPKWLRPELAYYTIMMIRAMYGSGMVLKHQVTHKFEYKFDDEGQYIPVRAYPPKLPLIKWGCYYYKTGEYWQENIRLNHLESEMVKIVDTLNDIKIGHFPTWNRDPKRTFKSNVLCEEYCDFKDFCTMHHDGFSCLKCEKHVNINVHDGIHHCNGKDLIVMDKFF